MDLTGDHRIAAPRDTVWSALNDPATLARAIPGCESFVRCGEDVRHGFDAKVSRRIGSLLFRFTGKVTPSDLDPPSGCTLKGEGSAGAAGFAQGEARIRLIAEGAEVTILSYVASVTVGGTLAEMGEKLLDPAAKSFAAEFFTGFSTALGLRVEPRHAPADEGGIGPTVWVSGFIVATLLLVVAFAML